jgi:hypothetical protein
MADLITPFNRAFDSSDKLKVASNTSGASSGILLSFLSIRSCFLNREQYLHIIKCTRMNIRWYNGMLLSIDADTFLETSLQLNIQ